MNNDKSKLLKKIALFVSVIGASFSIQAAEYTMKMGTATVDDVQTYTLNVLSKRIEERSGGRIKTEVYPGAQLGSNARMIEGLQFGTLEFYVGPYVYLVGVDSRYQITDAPGVFRDFEHAQATLTDPEFLDAFREFGDEKGILSVGTFVNGATAFATNFEGTKLDDFNGTKIRVLASEIEREGVGTLGATAVPVDFSEITAVLQQGAIDGVKSVPVAFNSLKLYDIVENVTATETDFIGGGMFVSKVWFESLPEDLQQIVLEETANFVPEAWAYSIKQHNEAYEVWENNGGTVYRLSDSEKDELSARLGGIAEDVLMQNEKTNEAFMLLRRIADKY